MTEIEEKVVLSPERLAKVQEVIKRYPEGQQKSALLPILHLVQEQFGWISAPAMDMVAELLDLQPVEVYEVTTFYTMFHLKPVGKHVIEYCRTGPCCNMGAEGVYEHLKSKLGIKEKETTSDGVFTLKEVECLAACGWGPCFQIREKFYLHLSNDKVDEIIDELRK
jgi:NADH-quinone oxidoreductase subunit E